MTQSQIYEQQVQQLKEEKIIISPEEIRERAAQDERVPLDFKAAVLSGHPGIIAPVESADGNDPQSAGRAAEKAALCYEKSGAQCMAVDGRFTFYDQQDAFIRRLRERIPLPLLRCIYTIDSYQVYQTLLLGYDAVLLLAALTEEDKEFLIVQTAHECGLQTVTLVNSLDEVGSAVSSGTDMIAAGNATDDGMSLEITRTLLAAVPDHITKLSFGGVSNRAELEQAASYGAAGVLVAPSFFA